MDLGTITEYFKFFVALVAVVNPVGMIPIFIDLTANQETRERHTTGNVAALSVGIILLLSLFTGEAILRFFGISVGSFRVGGGILILLMAIAMLNAKMSNIRQTREEEIDSAVRENVAVVPMATPLLAGPGAISTVILHAQRHHSPLHYLYLSLAIIALSGLTALLMRLAPHISQ